MRAKRVFGHGFLNIEGEKMSKSLGNVLSPDAMVAEFGLDPLRIFSAARGALWPGWFFFSRGFIHRINADLLTANLYKNCEGVVPECGDLNDEDTALLEASAGLLDTLRSDFDQQAFHSALEKIWVVRAANAYIDHQAPWALKNDPARMATVLYTLAETLRRLAILVQPVVPDASSNLLDQLAVPAEARFAWHIAGSYLLARTEIRSGELRQLLAVGLCFLRLRHA